MKQFDYIVRNKGGLRSNHVGQLAIRARYFDSTAITIGANGNKVKATQLMRLVTLGITQGCKVTITAEGPQENEAISELYRFFEYYL